MTSLSSEQIIQQIRGLVGKVLTESDDLKFYGCDWTKQYAPAPLAIALPKDTDEVVALVQFAYEHGVALVPSGGRTGLSGAAVAANGEVVVAFDLMNQIIDFDPSDRQLVCQAGVITQAIHEYAADQGLFYPVDFASSGSSQIGGNISTNAGGIKVIRYGLTRQWVVGLKVVTGEGKLLNLNKGLIKNATGYDLRQLFIGAEGTLGLIVEATIQLIRPANNLHVMVLGVENFKDIMAVLQLFRDKIDLTAFEFFSDNALAYVDRHSKISRPFAEPAPYYVLLEFESVGDHELDQAMALFESAVNDGLVTDGVLSQNQTQAQNLWKLREYISESISTYTPYKNDISVKVSKVPNLIAEVDAIVTEHYPDFEIVWFGHIGDGNVHLNILKPDDLEKQEFFTRCKKVSQWVFEVVEKYQGSISAEHGVGLLKKEGLRYSRSDEEIEYMKAMKAVFDPRNIINPGKIF
ncbi:MAG: FAD-binding oxidoreductase [Gammaproteobacteria bacterium]|nr:MAG: FAD-binding oxidoreductase [Gammaproteobacteria bacterium]